MNERPFPDWMRQIANNRCNSDRDRAAAFVLSREILTHFASAQIDCNPEDLRLAFSAYMLGVARSRLPKCQQTALRRFFTKVDRVIVGAWRDVVQPQREKLDRIFFER